jgi:hypothetical protein
MIVISLQSKENWKKGVITLMHSSSLKWGCSLDIVPHLTEEYSLQDLKFLHQWLRRVLAYETQSSVAVHAGFLFGISFDPEDGSKCSSEMSDNFQRTTLCYIYSRR